MSITNRTFFYKKNSPLSEAKQEKRSEKGPRNHLPAVALGWNLFHVLCVYRLFEPSYVSVSRVSEAVFRRLGFNCLGGKLLRNDQFINKRSITRRKKRHRDFKEEHH